MAVLSSVRLDWTWSLTCRSTRKLDGKNVNELKAVHAYTYKGLSYQAADDGPIYVTDDFSAGIGGDTTESIDKAFSRIIQEAEDSGISKTEADRLRKTLQCCRHVFRIKLGPDPPAKVAPLRILSKPNARPYRTPQRRYAPAQREFISKTMHEHEALGAVYKNPSAKWASPTYTVIKPGSSKLRFTVDLRGTNSQTVPVQSAMPHLESLILTTDGSKCFAKMYMAHSYWQFPFAEESQEMLSIQTPLGIYSSRRLFQGSIDSGNHFQAVTQKAFQGRVDMLLQWIDDFLIHAESEQELLDSLQKFFTDCEEFGLKIHAQKTELYQTSAKLCGRFIASDGVKFVPRHFNALVKMNKPVSGDELQQLLCATN